MGFFSKLFRKKTKDKYNIKPEENIAREVYGIPNPNKYDTPSTNKTSKEIDKLALIIRRVFL